MEKKYFTMLWVTVAIPGLTIGLIQLAVFALNNNDCNTTKIILLIVGLVSVLTGICVIIIGTQAHRMRRWKFTVLVYSLLIIQGMMPLLFCINSNYACKNLELIVGASAIFAMVQWVNVMLLLCSGITIPSTFENKHVQLEYENI